MGYLGERHNASLAGVSYLEVTKPTECVDGGWLFGIVNNNGIEGTHDMRVLDSAGVVDSNWTLLNDLGSSLSGTSLAHLWIWQRKVTAAEAGTNGPTGFRFDNLGGNRTMVAAILAYDGLNATDPIVDILMSADSGSAGTSVHVPNITSTEANQLVIRLGCARANVHYSPIAGYSEREDFNTLDIQVGSTAAFSLFWHEILKANTGATTAEFVDQSAPTVVAEHVGASIVLANPPPPESAVLHADGVADQSGYANATSGNIGNVSGDPSTPGGTGFTAS